MLLLLLTLGCLTSPNAYERRYAWLDDVDGDGFSEQDGDCDDDDPQVYPTAPEPCGSADLNCDGLPAAEPTRWFFDGDGDGWGDGNTSQSACEAPASHVAIDGDCNDDNPAVFPQADELCNAIDDDCDEFIDEDAIDRVMAWPDRDGDGFGDDGGVETVCPDSAGYVDDNSDCDDENADVRPDAIEQCNAIDDDCDGIIDSAEACDDAMLYDGGV